MSNHRGFSLIEIAIVLIIAGILIGVVLKGVDLVRGARAKDFTNRIRNWELAVWVFFDRKGRFPGDSDSDSIIGENGTDSVKDDLVSANFINPPYEIVSGSELNTIRVGSVVFYIFLGNDDNAGPPNRQMKNILVICKDSSCNSAFTDDETVYIEFLDTAIDGSSDGQQGFLIGAGKPQTVDNNRWIANFNNPPGGSSWDAANVRSAVYYFDQRRS